MSRGPVRLRDPLAQALGHALTDVLRSALKTSADQLSTVGEPWLTSAEAATLLSVSEDTLIRAAVAGELPYGKVGKFYRFSVRAIDQHLGYRPPEAQQTSERGAA